MHQHKDWKTHSRFANSLISEKMGLDALLACETDGEKRLIDGFQRNFLFATFLRCFIHFKGNIKTELKNRNISSTLQKLYMQEIFGKQEGTTKFCGLVDSESTQEFDQKLEGMNNDWNNRESGITNISFFDLFKQENVDQFLVWFNVFKRLLFMSSHCCQ